MGERIDDWDTAYGNAASIPNAGSFVEKWPEDAEAFRAATRCEIDLAYGDTPREKFDLFYPDGESQGLFIFVHGGYWHRFDKSFWSHLAAGPLSLGWHVALPSYTLAPNARVSDITQQIAQAIEVAAHKIDGPIVLAGHSAGGHLVTRQVCTDTHLPDTVLDRIARVISISGVHDLRPIMRLEFNEAVQLDEEEAWAESPALLAPFGDIPIDCVVGRDELPEFRRQNALLANIWKGLGAETSCHEIFGTHHFNVIDDLKNPQGLMCSLIHEPD
jgi:acetyl esterase/lipase